MQSPIFVCGVGRSGTSLVQSMLGAHSKIAFPPETGFFRRYVVRQVLTKRARKGGLKAVAEELQRDERMQRLDMDLHAAVDAFFEKRIPFSDAAFYQFLLERYAAAAGKPRVGDKDPRSIEYLPLIHTYWPKAHIVHVVRDPRDVLASKKKAAWSKSRSSFLHIFANAVQLRLGRKWGRQLFGSRYQEVIYEALLADPERVLKEVCRKLGLEYEAEMLAFSDTARQLVSQPEMAWKKETLGPLLTNNHGKWVSSLQRWEVALTEAACCEAFRHFPYTRSSNDLPLYGRVGLWGGRRVIDLTGAIYCAYRSWTVRMH